MLLSRGMVRAALMLVAFAIAFGSSSSASAQYKNAQFGFEAGYLGYGTTNNRAAAAVENHGPMVGVRTAWKLTDHFWLTNRAAFAWRDQIELVDRTIFILHLVPVAARYYFMTDRFRPFVGVTQSFQFFMNGQAGHVFWGPGGSAGFEVRLRKDVFLGLQADVFHMWGDGEFPAAAISLQLDLFL